MWKTERIKLTDNSMHLVSKLIIWFLFWEFVFSVITLINGTVDFIGVGLILITIIGEYILAKTNPSRIPVEVTNYIISLIKNKPAIVTYYVPNGVEKDEEDMKKRIYKL